MPDADKKKKKEDIEKLRMILDNPYNNKDISKDNPCLDSVKRRLAGGSSYKVSPSHPDYLKPHVTVHGPEKKHEISKEPSLKESVAKPPCFVEKKLEHEDLVDVKDLYDIEKIDSHKPSITEWKSVESTKEDTIPNWIPVETAPSKSEQTVLKPKEQILPEWTPIEVVTPKPEPIVEKPREKILPEWTPAEVVTPKPKPLIEKPKIEVEQPKEVIPRIVRDGKLDIFKDIKSIDPPTAELLYEKGFTSVESLRASSVVNLIRNGVEKRVARVIKKDIKQLDKKRTKQFKKAARLTVSVKTVRMDKPGIEWSIGKPHEIKKPLPETPVVEAKIPTEEELPVWDSVEGKEPIPKTKKSLMTLLKKDRTNHFKQQVKKEAPEKKKPVVKAEKIKEKKSTPKKKKEIQPVHKKKPLLLFRKEEKPKRIQRRGEKEVTVKEKPVVIAESTKDEEIPAWGSVKGKESPLKKKKIIQPVHEKKPLIAFRKEERPTLFKRRVKKEITVKETIVDESEEWVRKPERTPIKKPLSIQLPDQEWEHQPTAEAKSEPVIKKPEPVVQQEESYHFGGYSLYKKEIQTADGKLRTIHFFSKTPLQDSTPAMLPEGFEVVVNEKTGLPFLKKKTP